jgi:hypothetical protein
MALGLYMARRIIGESAEVQKRRLLRLAERITIEECYGNIGDCESKTAGTDEVSHNNPEE